MKIIFVMCTVEWEMSCEGSLMLPLNLLKTIVIILKLYISTEIIRSRCGRPFNYKKEIFFFKGINSNITKSILYIHSTGEWYVTHSSLIDKGYDLTGGYIRAEQTESSDSVAKRQTETLIVTTIYHSRNIITWFFYITVS